MGTGCEGVGEWETQRTDRTVPARWVQVEGEKPWRSGPAGGLPPVAPTPEEGAQHWSPSVLLKPQWAQGQNLAAATEGAF